MSLLIYVRTVYDDTIPIELPMDGYVQNIIDGIPINKRVVRGRIFFQDTILKENTLLADSGLSNEAMVEYKTYTSLKVNNSNISAYLRKYTILTSNLDYFLRFRETGEGAWLDKMTLANKNLSDDIYEIDYWDISEVTNFNGLNTYEKYIKKWLTLN